MRFDRTAKIYLLILLLSTTCIALFVYVSRQSQQDVRTTRVHDMPIHDTEATYIDIHGNPVTLSTYAGMPMLINVWATWTPFSKDELARLTTLAQQFKGEIAVIAINRNEPVSVVRSYMRQYPDTDDIIVLIDTQDRFYQSIAGFTMPETLFYTSDGLLIQHTRGALTKTDLLHYLQHIRIEKP